MITYLKNLEKNANLYNSQSNIQIIFNNTISESKIINDSLIENWNNSIKFISLPQSVFGSRKGSKFEESDKSLTKQSLKFVDNNDTKIAKAYETNRSIVQWDNDNYSTSKTIMKMNAKLKSSISYIKNHKVISSYKSAQKSLSQNNSLEKEVLLKSKSKKKLKVSYEKDKSSSRLSI